MITTDEDDIMPPPDSHKELSKEEKDIIRQWIEDGAEYQKHWAFEPITMSEVPAEDPAVYAMIQRADTVGVFQIESRAQMAMMRRGAGMAFTHAPSPLLGREERRLERWV